MKDPGFGTKTTLTLSGKALNFAGCAFVDDTNPAQMAVSPPCTGETIRASGGGVPPERKKMCFAKLRQRKRERERESQSQRWGEGDRERQTHTFERWKEREQEMERNRQTDRQTDRQKRERQRQ